MASLPLLLLFLLLTPFCLALTKAEQKKLDSVCQIGISGLKAGVSQAIKFTAEDIVIACEAEMFEEAMDIPQHAIYHTEHYPFGCFACVKKQWLENYCSLPIPTNTRMVSPWIRQTEPIVAQNRETTRLGEWVYSNDCNRCSPQGMCTLMMCGDKWIDRIYNC